MGRETRVEQQAGNGPGSGIGADVSVQIQDLMKEANQKKPLQVKDEKGPETDPAMRELKDKIQVEKLPPAVPSWFKQNDRNMDGALSLAEIDKRPATMPMYKCVTEESQNLHRMRENFGTIAGDDELIQFPELYAYNKQHPFQMRGCGGE